jgi:hypothetical protein
MMITEPGYGNSFVFGRHEGGKGEGEEQEEKERMKRRQRRRRRKGG